MSLMASKGIILQKLHPRAVQGILRQILSVVFMHNVECEFRGEMLGF